MSRSNPTDNLQNPAVRFFDVNGGDGTVSYYDKSLGEKGENVTVELPFKFLILDTVKQIAGGIDRDGSYTGFFSNAIRNLKTQQFIVRSKGRVEVQGYYEDIKGYPGVKFVQGVYIAFYADDKSLQIGYLKLKGAALTAWIEFGRSHKNIYDGAFGIVGAAKKKKGTNTYFEPVFEHFPKVSEDADDAAKMLDVQLQDYLTAYFAQAGIAEVEAEYSGGEHVDESPEMPPMNLDAEPPDEDFPF